MRELSFLNCPASAEGVAVAGRLRGGKTFGGGSFCDFGLDCLSSSIFFFTFCTTASLFSPRRCTGEVCKGSTTVALATKLLLTSWEALLRARAD